MSKATITITGEGTKLSVAVDFEPALQPGDTEANNPAAGAALRVLKYLKAGTPELPGIDEEDDE